MKGFLLSADSRLFEVLSVTASCFKASGLENLISMLCCHMSVDADWVCKQLLMPPFFFTFKRRCWNFFSFDKRANAFFFANEYFFFVMTSNSALSLLLGLIRLVSFKSRSENLKTQDCRSSPWSGGGERSHLVWLHQWAYFFQLTMSSPLNGLINLAPSRYS